LHAIARQAMLDRGFLVQLPEDAQKQLATEGETLLDYPDARDLTGWMWSSIDNDESRDLDQIEYVKSEAGGIRLYVGIADVDWFVPLRSPLDTAAQHNTISVYTGVQTFPMLPEKLSTNLSSLNEGQKRRAVIVEMLVGNDGRILESGLSAAIVQNRAQLTYDAVAFWLQSNSPSARDSSQSDQGSPRGTLSPVGERVWAKIDSSEELKEQLRIQDRIALILRNRRHEAGALNFQTSELEPLLSSEGTVVDLKAREPNRAGRLIEDFMVAANQVTATFLEQQDFPSVRRVVEVPEHWDRIAALAAEKGARLPQQPDSRSLEDFLGEQQQRDPDHFPDLSLSIIKLLGRGEYKVKSPGQPSPGHFALAVQNYSHSTAPNRRYSDLLTQRLIKAAVQKRNCPYSIDDLETLARRCTEKEDDANKVERFVKKCAAAVVLRARIGQIFHGFITGASEKGTWVRVKRPPVEGKLIGDVAKLQVGDKVSARLVSTDPQKGFIDFELLHRS
jgi:exoribonuclease-2